MLTNEQLDFYCENGYLMIDDALSAQQLELLQGITHSFIEASRHVTQGNDIYDLDQGHSADNPRLTRIKLPHKQHPAFWEVLTSDRITSLLTPLLGPDIRLHTSKLNTKAPGGGAAVEWHQDWAFYPHTNDDMLAIGVQTLYPRLVDVPVQMPLPPAPDSSSIFKVQQSSGAKSAFA